MSKYRRPYSRMGRKFLRGAMQATSVALRYRNMGGRSYTKTKQKTATVGVTRQYDSKLQYRKKWMPKYKKRKWVAFSKKVKAVNAKDEGTKTVVFNNLYSVSRAANTQDYNAFYLYGNRNNNTASELGGGDLNYIYANATDSTQTVEKLKFKSAVFDMTLTNTGTLKLEVDLYHVQFYGMGKYASLSSAHGGAVSLTPTVDNGSAVFSSVSLAQRGVTPFDMPELIRGMQCTIVKKVKFFVDSFNEITYQIRDPKERTISEFNVVNGNQNLALPRITQGVIIIAKGISGDSGETIQYSARITRKYSFTDGTQGDASGWVAF